ncbi:Hypothetical predicted protein [Lecanosticta acicola]|uniref:Uncharacterized protein n=1 Tax=Lecanosticta acicola TaxID=111012 RepID=A0AAI8YZM7_9PEZI|nr:Hypothetical predicted protein [Lecanosticta acicola]
MYMPAASGFSSTTAAATTTTPLISYGITPQTTDHSSLAAAISGGIVGGCAVLAALVFGIFYWRRWRCPSVAPSPQDTTAYKERETNGGGGGAAAPKFYPSTSSCSTALPSLHVSGNGEQVYHELPGSATEAELDGSPRFVPVLSDHNGKSDAV